MEPPNQLYQFSVVSALIDGVANHGLAVSELLRHGDFGLGTFRHMVGEMIIVDGLIYEMRSDGSVSVVETSAYETTTTPFAMITRFQPTAKTEIMVQSKTMLAKLLSKVMEGTKNHYLSFKIHGKFSSIVVRTVGGQQTPHQGLAEVGKNQATHSFNDIEGTIVGFRSPSFLQGVSVAGDHLHFISADKKSGGHVLECEANSKVALSVAYISLVQLQLPTNDDDYNQAELALDAENISAVEG
jgi:alpha-acetolactate decarboxylase